MHTFRPRNKNQPFSTTPLSTIVLYSTTNKDKTPKLPNMYSCTQVLKNLK